MTQKSKTQRPKSGQRRAEKPVDAEIKAAGERIGYRPTEPCPPPQAPKDDPDLHRGLLALTGRTSELMAMIETWGNDSPSHADVMSLFEQLSELNLEIWRLRWNGSNLAEHEVAS